MEIISLENAILTRDVTPHESLHKAAFVGRINWMKCEDTYTGLAAVCRWSVPC